jgi:hypothetical protein
MSERPWLSVDFYVNEPIEFQPDGSMSVHVHPVIKNTGHSVATNIRLILRTNPEGIGFWFMDVRKQQTESCDEWRKLDFPDDTIGPLFEGGTYVENLSFTVAKADIQKAQFKQADGKVVITGLALFGCVDYRFVFAPDHHQTGFSYDLGTLGPIRPKNPLREHLSWEVGKDIPASSLAVTRSLFGRFYID